MCNDLSSSPDHIFRADENSPYPPEPVAQPFKASGISFLFEFLQGTASAAESHAYGKAFMTAFPPRTAISDTCSKSGYRSSLSAFCSTGGNCCTTVSEGSNSLKYFL